MTGMDKKRELRDHWQRVCKLILTTRRASWFALDVDARLRASRGAHADARLSENRCANTETSIRPKRDDFLLQ